MRVTFFHGMSRAKRNSKGRKIADSTSATEGNVNLSLDAKKNIINAYMNSNPKLSYRELAALNGVCVSTIGNIIRNKDKILEIAQNVSEPQFMFRMRKPKNKVLDLYMFKWFQSRRKKLIALNGPLIQNEAKGMANSLGMVDFKASEGWLDKFKLRYNIYDLGLSGESASVDLSRVDEWKKASSELINSYEEENIFNVDETSLFWKCTPKRSLVFRGERAAGTKKSKERLTLLLCCSATGEKLAPIIIGKSKNPRCFARKKLPITYKSNSSAWMTTSIFLEWLEKLNLQMKNQPRKILLLLDNATVHPVDLEFTNIKLLYFPKNSTAVIQPLDQGIIQNFKVKYRFKLMSFLASFKELDENWVDASKFTLFDAVHWIVQAWDEVTTHTIASCFNHGNFLAEKKSERNDSKSSAEEFLEALSSSCSISGLDFATFDDSFSTCEEFPENIEDEKLLESAKMELESEPDCETEDEAIVDDIPVEPRHKTMKQVVECYEDILYYLDGQELGDDIWTDLMKVRSHFHIIQSRNIRKQRKITDFFQ